MNRPIKGEREKRKEKEGNLLLVKEVQAVIVLHPVVVLQREGVLPEGN